MERQDEPGAAAGAHRVRHRGRGRREGVGRGQRGGVWRGQRRGRGRGRLNLAAIRQQQQDREAERRRHIMDMIARLPVADLQEIMQRLVERQPGLFFDIWERLPRVGPPQPQLPEWCTCSRCGPMGQLVENICCAGTPEECLSLQPEVDALVLDPHVLGIAQALRNELFGVRYDRDDPQRCLRHTAYRQYILWQFNRLGRGNRRVIPSCMVRRIRATFPDPRGVYTGYVPARLV